MLAAKPSGQAGRLAALRSLDILDSDPEPDWQALAELAATLCLTPIALISFVEDDRQWFKATFGTDLTGTGLDSSICSHAILHDEILEIPDTFSDNRTSDMPICVEDPHIRFYAGYPIRSSGGEVLGTICVLDRSPRRLEPGQHRSLALLAGQVERLIELREKVRQLDFLHREVDHRVKNSLQSISSLARLQARQSGDPETRGALQAMRQRIGLSAIMHDAIYRDDYPGNIDLADFLGHVTTHIGNGAPVWVKVVADVEPIRTDATIATAIATAMGEFASNSFKFGYGDRRKGIVSMKVREIDGMIVVDMWDEGVGTDPAAYPEGEVPMRPGGIGHRIIQASVQQLGGLMRLGDPRDGFSLRLSIPNL